MCSKNELLDDLQDQLIPKSEPIDKDFIKTEEFEEGGYVVQKTVEVDKDSVKVEILENENGSASRHQYNVSEDYPQIFVYLKFLMILCVKVQSNVIGQILIWYSVFGVR